MRTKSVTAGSRLGALTLAIVLASESALAQSHGRTPAAPPPVVAPPEPTPASVATKLRDEGNEAMLGMRYADALESYRKALAATPEDAGLHYSLARAQQFVGDYPAALAELEAFDAKASPDAKARVGKLDDLYAQLRPRVATLELTCSDVGARVLVRDHVVGTTPMAPLRLPAGASTLQVELDGFFPVTRDIVLPGGGKLAIDVPLHRRSTSGFLGITSDPVGAHITVDGHDFGTTSPRVEAALAAGPHEVVASHDGYQDAKVSLVVAPGATRDIAVPLERSRSVLTRWWFWTTVGVAIAGGIALTYALTTEKSAGHGTLTPGQVGGP